MELDVDINYMRIDLFLAKRFPIHSRGFFQRCIQDGLVKKNGRVVKKANEAIKSGDRLTVAFPTSQKIPPLASPLKNIPVIFEDHDMLVLDKPAYVSVESIITNFNTKQFFLCHRLDKNTSGVLVIAKGVQNLAALQKQWKERTVQKTYIVLVNGRLEPKKGRIEAPISRSLKNRTRMAVSATQGGAKAAYTEYKVLRYLNGTTLLSAHPLTGRTHQIRVHFAAIGHPVIGDATYGVTDERLKRQFLHAHKLTLLNPRTGKKLTFESKLPKDLRSYFHHFNLAI